MPKLFVSPEGVFVCQYYTLHTAHVLTDLPLCGRKYNTQINKLCAMTRHKPSFDNFNFPFTIHDCCLLCYTLFYLSRCVVTCFMDIIQTSVLLPSPCIGIHELPGTVYLCLQMVFICHPGLISLIFIMLLFLPTLLFIYTSLATDRPASTSNCLLHDIIIVSVA